MSYIYKFHLLYLDVTSDDIGDPCTPINLNFDEFYFLSEGVSNIDIKFTSHRCAPVIDDDSTCHVLVLYKQQYLSR